MDAIFERSTEVANYKRCEHAECESPAIECRIWNDQSEAEDTHYFCEEHAEELGFCRLCGCFAMGTDCFDFVHPGFCETCWDQIEGENPE